MIHETTPAWNGYWAPRRPRVGEPHPAHRTLLGMACGNLPRDDADTEVGGDDSAVPASNVAH